ncbi:MAG: hypothetical protein ABL893_15570, partial [Hyphomicrobium sp.]
NSITRFGNASDNILASGGGNDLLRGFEGADTLSGNGGRDEYVFRSGDGADVIDDMSVEGGVIRFDSSIDLATITQVEVAGANGASDLLITYGAGDTIRIVNWSLLSEQTQAAWSLENSPAPVLTSADLSVYPDNSPPSAATNTVTGTTGNDTIIGEDAPQFIDALAGNDIVKGNAGDDQLYGGNGNDDIDGGYGVDTIKGDAGNDIIRGDRGDDKLDGGSGADTYVFFSGDGRDTINGDSTDTLQFAAGIKPSDIIFVRPFATKAPSFLSSTGSDLDVLRLEIGTTGDSVEFAAGNFMAVRFADGTAWSAVEVEAIAEARIQATSGNDDIMRGVGDQVLAGGAGNDRMSGGVGSDTYVWNRGDGNDIVRDYNQAATTDRLVFGPGIGPGDITITRLPANFDEFNLTGHNPYADALITIAGPGGGSVQLYDFFDTTSISGTLDLIAFDDGSVWTYGDIAARVVIGPPTSGADTLTGSPATETINGGAGNDTISGGTPTQGQSAFDVLIGGDGNDSITGSGTMIGGAGNDTFSSSGVGYTTFTDVLSTALIFE